MCQDSPYVLILPLSPSHHCLTSETQGSSNEVNVALIQWSVRVASSLKTCAKFCKLRHCCENYAAIKHCHRIKSNKTKWATLYIFRRRRYTLLIPKGKFNFFSHKHEIDAHTKKDLYMYSMEGYQSEEAALGRHPGQLGVQCLSSCQSTLHPYGDLSYRPSGS